MHSFFFFFLHFYHICSCFSKLGWLFVSGALSSFNVCTWFGLFGLILSVGQCVVTLWWRMCCNWVWSWGGEASDKRWAVRLKECTWRKPMDSLGVAKTFCFFNGWLKKWKWLAWFSFFFSSWSLEWHKKITWIYLAFAVIAKFEILHDEVQWCFTQGKTVLIFMFLNVFFWFVIPD